MPNSADPQYNPACDTCQVNSLKKFSLKINSLAEISLTVQLRLSYRQFHDNILASPCQVFFAEFSPYETITTDYPPPLFEKLESFFIIYPKLTNLENSQLIIRAELHEFEVRFIPLREDSKMNVPVLPSSVAFPGLAQNLRIIPVEF